MKTSNNNLSFYEYILFYILFLHFFIPFLKNKTIKKEVRPSGQTPFLFKTIIFLFLRIGLVH